MELNHEFTVHQPIDEAWRILTDVERIAPCLPGAQLQEIEGDTYRGIVKVKVGAINAQFKGEAHFVERDDAGHRAVLKAAGRDTGGRGNASALITAQLEAKEPHLTVCRVDTHLDITGKVASFGRGALADVSDKLLAQFSTNLNQLIEHSTDAEVAPAAEAAPAADEAAAAAPAAAEASGDQAEAPTPTAVRKIDGPAAEPIDLLDAAGGAMLKRLLPLLGGIVLLLLLLRRRRSS